MDDLVCLLWYGDEERETPRTVPVKEATHTWAGTAENGVVNPFLISCLLEEEEERVPVAVSLAVSRRHRGNRCERLPTNALRVHRSQLIGERAVSKALHLII